MAASRKSSPKTRCRNCPVRGQESPECATCDEVQDFVPEIDEVEEVDYSDFLDQFREHELA